MAESLEAQKRKRVDGGEAGNADANTMSNAKRVASIESAPTPMQVDSNASGEKGSEAGTLIHGFGFADELSAKGYKNFWSSRGPKERGSFEDYDPITSRMLAPGVDCEAILHNKDFDCHKHGRIEEDAAIITYGFTQPVNYLGRYRMPADKLNTWLQEVGAQYSRDTQYHNWHHAFDVFQLSFLALTDGGASEYFNFQDCCSIMIAAIAHDVGHKGTNNAFQVKARTELALLYNDRSPMENMHASLLFQILRKPDANFLEHLKDEDFSNMRSKIIDMILDTDPTHHFPVVEKMATRIKRGAFVKYVDVPNADEEANKNDRGLLLQGFVHMWDIGNGFRTWDVYKVLVASLEEEFHAQGDQEKELGLQPTMMMDREKDRLAACQDFFLGKLVLPLFDLYATVMKDDIADLFRTRLEQNKQNWQVLLKKHGPLLAREILALETGLTIEK